MKAGENKQNQSMEYVKHFMTVEHRGCRVYVASKLLDGGGRLLDVGCGDGALAVLVRDKYKEVFGVDNKLHELEIAEKRGMKTVKRDLDRQPLPFKDNFFDAVTCLDVIEHVLDPINLIEEAHRVLKKNGILVISTPNIRYWKHILSLVKGRFPKTSDDTKMYDGGHTHYFTFRDIEEILKKQGFGILDKKGTFGKNFFIEFRSVQVMIKARKI